MSTLTKDDLLTFDEFESEHWARCRVYKEANMPDFAKTAEIEAKRWAATAAYVERLKACIALSKEIDA